MDRKRLTTAAIALPVLAALLCGASLVSRSLSARTGEARAGRLAPRLVLPRSERDLGTVSQGGTIRAVFPIRNAGIRRLIVMEEGKGCCGEPAEPRRIILAPGESTSVEVEVNTAQWHGRVEHAVHYTTNDPELPRFALTVTANVESR
ncbi:MAG: DUF1573 domain-containing protein [Planctomycetota bacterium]